jgi:putative PIN family toxin of toxin-antitoxin system
VSIPVVYDTMLYFQAASRPDRVHATFQAVLDKRVTLCISPKILAEVQDVLTRPEYVARFPALSAQAVTLFLSDVALRARLFDPVPATFTWPTHPDDDHVFNLAIHAKAKYLVTWERRILKLATDTTPAADSLRRLAPDLAIVTPKQMADVLRATRKD